MTILILAFGPLISYFILLFYTAISSVLLGKEWTDDQVNMLFEYIVIISIYYCITLPYGAKKHYLEKKK